MMSNCQIMMSTCQRVKGENKTGANISLYTVVYMKTIKSMTMYDKVNYNTNSEDAGYASVQRRTMPPLV